MRNLSLKFILLFFANLIFTQEQSPVLDIANELLVRQKLSNKLPDVFDDLKFTEMINKLDNISQVNPKTHRSRITLNNPEFHWCYAQTYLLAGKSVESLDHYRKYKIQTRSSSESIHPLFKKPINELEVALENQQAELAHEIYATITNFKNEEGAPANSQIQNLQNKLNTFNELKNNSRIIVPDGIIGPLTKSAIYDFEENNPYFVFQKHHQVQCHFKKQQRMFSS